MKTTGLIAPNKRDAFGPVTPQIMPLTPHSSRCLDSAIRFVRTRRVHVLIASIVIALLLGACQETGSIEEIRAMQADRHFKESVEPLRIQLDTSPDDPELNYRYGVALRATGAPDRAIWALRKAAESEEWGRVASLELGDAALDAGEWSSAISLADSLLEQDDDDFQALRIRGTARLNGKTDFEGALEDFEVLMDENSRDLDAGASRVAAMIELDRVDEAAEAINELEKQAAELGGDSALLARICATGAVFRSERSLHEQAEAQFELCRSRHPRDLIVLNGFLEYLDGRGQHDRASQLMLDHLKTQPELSNLRMSLSSRLILAGRVDESEAILREGLDLKDPRGVSDVWAGLADHYIAIDDLKAAAEAYEKSLSLLAETTPQQRLNLADVLARSNQDERALEVAKTLGNEMYRGLIEARVMMNRKQPDRALTLLDEILPLWPNNPGARYWAARAAEQTGRFNRAIEEYRQAIRSSPAFSDAGLRLGLIHEAEGAVDDAWAAVFPYADERPNDPEAVALMVRLASRGGGSDVRLRRLMDSLRPRPIWPFAVAERADFLAKFSGPENAVEAIQSLDNFDLEAPTNAPVLRSFAIALGSLDRFEEAHNVVTAALLKTPESSLLHQIEAELHVRSGDEPKAQAAFERATNLNAENAGAHRGLAALFAHRGDLASAEQQAEIAISLEPQEREGYLPLAQAFAEAGERSKEAGLYQRLLIERPFDAEANMAWARLRFDGGDHGDQTLDHARRARRFLGGLKAAQLLADIYQARGQDDLARKVLERSEVVKSAPAAQAPAPKS